MQYFLSIDGFITGVVALVFGILIIAKDRKNKINQTLFLLTIATAFWSFGYWRWLSVINDGESALFWSRILSIGSLFIPVFYFHWILTLLDLDKRKKGLLITSYSFAFICFLFSFSGFFVNRVEPIEGYFAFWPKPGWLYSVYLFTIYSGLVIYSVVLLLKAYKNNYGFKRLQIRYVLLGTIFGFGGGATNFFLWYDIPILPVGNVLVVSYPILFTYSIIKHRLMDIKLVMRRYSVYIISASSILLVALGIKYITNLYFLELSTTVDFLILVFAILTYPSIKDYYYKIANKYFFSSLYDSRQVIAEISDSLRSTLEINKIYDFIHKTLDGAFHLKSFGVLAFNDEDKDYHVQYNNGFNIGNKKKFSGNKLLHATFLDKNESIVVEEIRNTHYNKDTKELIDLLGKLQVDVVTPLNVKDKTVGLLILGPKESGDMYNDEDLSVLRTVGAQAAIAIENALLYKESKEFGLKLTREVEKATRDLRQANLKLTKLDKAKSEFISIASHQLRTPLTVIKGYISMILEGNFGKLLPEQKDSLKKVFDSGERLIQLVENLLNVSRIESGRLKFLYKTMQLEDLIESVIEELAPTAKKKNLKFKYNKPEKKLPKVRIDEEKLRQVVMNLVDNAIKYTAKGRVEIDLKLEKKKISFCVSDSGMGIEEGDMPNLFKKFSRGNGTSVVHTEGTGLGLYVARQMIEAHNGKVWAESKGSGKGSKFCFLLPVK